MWGPTSLPMPKGNLHGTLSGTKPNGFPSFHQPGNAMGEIHGPKGQQPYGHDLNGEELQQQGRMGHLCGRERPKLPGNRPSLYQATSEPQVCFLPRCTRYNAPEQNNQHQPGHQHWEPPGCGQRVPMVWSRVVPGDGFPNDGFAGGNSQHTDIPTKEKDFGNLDLWTGHMINFLTKTFATLYQ